jgi:DNA polymerase I-like protein with 3'-5' exonuclease and polymerase domains
MNLAAFDLETSGRLPEYALQPWRVRRGDAWITCFVGAWKPPGAAPEIESALLGAPMAPAVTAFLRGCLERRQRVAGWNLAFDISWLLALDDPDLTQAVFETRWLDGMLLWRHATIEPEYDTERHKKKSYGLKEAVAARWPEHAGYEDDVDYHATDPENLRKLYEYNVRDTVFSLRLTQHWWRQLEPSQQRAALIEASTLPLIAQANLEGMVVDTLVTRELEQHLADTAAKKLEALAPHGITEKIVRSPKQLPVLMYDVWKLPVLKENTGKKTGVVSRSTDKEVLHELSFIDPRAKVLHEYREALNNRTKFATNILKSVDYNEDGRTHPLAHVFGTYTSRLTYSSKQGKNKDERPIGFALHQEKRDPKFRSVIQAPPGYTIVEFDASGQEYRWMAIASGDEAMLSLCQPGEDPHAYMGAQIASLDYRYVQHNAKTDDHAGLMRQMGKVGNLSCQYRVSARKLLVVARVQYNMPLVMDQAKLIHHMYPRVYPGVKDYWGRQIRQARRDGYVETLAGRRVQLPGAWTSDTEWQMGSTAINYRIQGTGGDQKYLALSMLRPCIARHGAQFAWDLHDGIYFYVPTPRVHEFIAEANPILNTLPYEQAWGFTPPIPLPWDCKYGTSWGTLKEYKHG